MLRPIRQLVAIVALALLASHAVEDHVHDRAGARVASPCAEACPIHSGSGSFDEPSNHAIEPLPMAGDSIARRQPVTIECELRTVANPRAPPAV